MSEDSMENRKQTRYSVTCLLYYAGVKAFGYAYTRNLSEGGCFVETDEPVERGEEFDTEVFFDFGTRVLPMRASAKVMWINSDVQAGRLGMGLLFQRMDVPARDCLDRALEFAAGAQSPLPGRAL